jgi:hypothetical protein
MSDGVFRGRAAMDRGHVLDGYMSWTRWMDWDGIIVGPTREIYIFARHLQPLFPLTGDV